MKLGHIGYLPRRFGSFIPAKNLFDALRTRLLRNVPTLADCYRRESPGKVASGSVPEPYCIYNVLGETPDWVSGVAVYPAWLDVQLTFVAASDLAAEAVRDAAYLLFTPRRNNDGSPANTLPAFLDGGLSPYAFLPGRKTEYKNPGKGPNGQPLWLFSFMVRFYVTRSV